MSVQTLSKFLYLNVFLSSHGKNFFPNTLNTMPTKNVICSFFCSSKTVFISRVALAYPNQHYYKSCKKVS